MTIALVTLIVIASLSAATLTFVCNRVSYLEVPFMIALVYLAWLVPQALLQLETATVPTGGLCTLLLFALCALGMLMAGWYVAAPTVALDRGVTPLARMLDLIGPMRSHAIAGAFVGVALAIQVTIQLQPAEELAMRNPSGLITILRFFATINSIALFLALAVALTRRSPVSFALLALAIGNYAPAVLLQVKRGELVELGFTMMSCFWMVRGWALPRPLVLVLGCLMFIVLWGVSELRGLSGYQVDDAGNVERQVVSISEAAEVNWSSVLSDNLGDTSELINGSFLIDHINHTGEFVLGTNLWNNMVHQWVPGQFVGRDLKERLLLPSTDLQDVLAANGMEWQIGTTSTGFPEVYGDFGFAALLVFFVMAWVAHRTLFRGVVGRIEDAAVYPAMAVLAMTSVTHGGYTFFKSLPLLLAARLLIGVMAGTMHHLPSLVAAGFPGRPQSTFGRTASAMGQGRA